MKEMQVGDKVLFYHSNCNNPGIAGFAESAHSYCRLVLISSRCDFTTHLVEKWTRA
ncbi:hypothetical protein C8Q75DRAFT_777788 [Abortiporus biennis]|nr:hypothetical protein C8Q75DRAFT_777788 [Abortiporus biennis]